MFAQTFIFVVYTEMIKIKSFLSGSVRGHYFDHSNNLLIKCHDHKMFQAIAIMYLFESLISVKILIYCYQITFVNDVVPICINVQTKYTILLFFWNISVNRIFGQKIFI